MNKLEIKNSLIERFKQALLDGESRKIVYWIDTEQAFEEIFNELEIEDVKKHRLLENNYFYTKYLLEEEDTESHYLIYTTEPMEINIDNWLSDNVMYSDKFYADEVSMILRDFEIPENLRNTVNSHKKFFRSNDRYNRLKEYNIEEYSLIKLHKAMACAICKISKPSFELALRKVFLNGIDDDNKLLKDLYSFLGENEFWSIISESYGYESEEHSLKKLAIHLMITAASLTIDDSVLDSFKAYISKKQKNNCMLFIDRWLNDSSDENYNTFAKLIEDEIMFISMIQKNDIEVIKSIEVFPSVDKLIIVYITNSIKQNKEDYDSYLNIIETRRALHFYNEYKYIYGALTYSLNMFKFKKDNNYMLSKALTEEYISRYTNELYKMDFYYRNFYENYDAANDNDVIKEVRRSVEDLYNNWYLTKLSLEYSDSLEIENNIYNLKVRYQHDFYKRFIEKHVNNNEKVFVVISDALRV